MLFLLSPAKSLDYATPPHLATHTQPLFTRQSAELIEVLKTQSPPQIARLMKISDTLAGLNVARYEAWSPRFTAKNSKQALLAFDGDVYSALNAQTLTETQLAWTQEHLCILSGLYGVLRPLDWMQPYRLEMGTALVTHKGKNLYQFWEAQLAKYLNTRTATHPSSVIINLASVEYFKAIDRKALKARVVNCVFEEFRDGKYKIVSFAAKRARGLMMRYAIENELNSVKALEDFEADGYRFDPGASEPDTLVFRRQPAG